MKKLFLLFMIILPFLVSAGAWNKKKGSGYAQISYTFLTYNRLLQGSDKPFGLKHTIFDQTIQFYEEYGISDRFNLIINIPYKLVSSGSGIRDVENDPYVQDTLQSGSMNGFSNLSFGTRMTILEKKFVLAAKVMVMNEMFQYQPNTGLRIGYEAWFVTPSLLAGRGWDRRFIQGEAGIQLNSGEYAYNFIGNFEYGYKLGNKKSILMFRLDAKVPITKGTYDEGTSVQTGLFRDNSSYISPGIKFSRLFRENWYLNLAAYGAFFSENEGANATLNAGIAYEW